MKRRNTGKLHFHPVCDNDICIRAMRSNFSGTINAESVCGCLIRPAGNGKPSSCAGPLSLLVQMFACRGQKDDFRRAEAGAIFPLELMLCKLLSLCKLSFQPSVWCCLASGSGFCCSMVYCPHGIFGQSNPLIFLLKIFWGWTLSSTVQKSVGHFFCSAFAFVKGE